MLKTLINPFAKDLRQIRRDFQLIHRDLQFIQNGGVVYYAVDFSELFAYANPHATNREIKIFSDDNDHETSVIQYRALNQLFFTRRSLVMLPPYAFELELWINRIRTLGHEKLARTAASALAELKKLVGDQRFEKALKATADPATAGNQGELQRLFQYLSENAGHLLRLLDETSFEPQERMRTLLQSSTFNTLKSLGKGEVAATKDVMDRWVNLLHGTRAPSESCSTVDNEDYTWRSENTIRDAMAIAQVDAFNRSSKNELLRLVTRSRSMLEQAQSNESDYWNDIGGFPLRNTRLFALLSSFGSDEIESAVDAIKRIEDATKAIDLFLTSYDDLNDAYPDETALASLQDQMETIKATWHKGSQLATSVDFETQPSRMKGFHKVIDLFTNITNSQALTNAVIDELLHVVRKLDMGCDYLGFEVQLLSRGSDTIINDKVDIPTDGGGYRLKSRHYPMPFGISLSSKRVIEIAEKFRQGEFTNLEALQESLSRSADEVAAHERLLLMSYVFALWGKWDVAYHYGCAAVTSGAVGSDKSEANFLIAVAETRRRNADAESFANAFQRLGVIPTDRGDRKALRLKCLAEKASIIFRWHGVSGDHNTRPRITDAVTYAREALTLADEDQSIKLFLLNNLCYFYVTRDSSSKKAYEFLNLFEKQVEAAMPVWTDRSPEILDTQAWSQWVLRGKRLSPETLTQLTVYLRYALGDPYLSVRQKETISRHLATISCEVVEVEKIAT